MIVQSGNSETARQLQDIESLLSRGVQVLVVVAHDPTAMGRAVAAAHAADVPVICYDRLITGCDVDLYLSFDNVRVGRFQAEYLVKRLGGKGRIIRVHGPKTDQTGLLFKQGQDEVLAPLIARGDIVVVHEDYAAGWKPAEAKRIVNAAITARGPTFDAVLATNDGTAGGAIQALIEEGLAGKVLVTGQDADLAACQRIVARDADHVGLQAPGPARRSGGGCGRCARPPSAGDRPRWRGQRRQGRAQHPRVRGRRRPREPRGDRDPRRLPPRGGPAMSRAGVAPPILESCGVAMHFGGVKALDGVEFDVRAGEVHALCGENGAGKLTLIKVLSGVHPFGSYSGSIQVDGREARFRSPRDAENAGIAVIHQELALVEEMSVAENLFLGHLPRRGVLVDWPRLTREAAELLRRFDVDVDPEAPAGSLGVGRKQQVAILGAVRKRSRVLILDEPTAALGQAEASRLLNLVRQLAREGVACVYITHRLEEVRAVADRVTVLRDGRSVAAFPTGAVPPGELIRAMAGRPVAEAAPARRPPAAGQGPALLEVSGLAVAADRGRPARLSDITFGVHAGEVVGIAGLMGAGRSELLMHCYGAWGVRMAGSVRLLGEPHDHATPRMSLARGLALVTEDRRRFGLVPDRSVEFNLTLSALKRLANRGLLDMAEEVRLYREMAGLLRVRASSPEMPIRSLSGGNQQKILLGRALLAEPRVILLDEPTRGVNVATKFEIYDLINALTEQGRGVLLVTSELPELLGLSDRLLVLRGADRAGAAARTVRPRADPRRRTGIRDLPHHRRVAEMKALRLRDMTMPLVLVTLGAGFAAASPEFLRRATCRCC